MDPVGYKGPLRAILLVANFDAVAAVQHLLGLAMAVVIYLLLVRRGTSRWLAALATIPVLFDPLQLDLEQYILTDISATFLVLVALVVLVWKRDAIGKAGIVPMQRIWDNGFRQTTTSTKPVQTPDDFRGMKLRVPVSPLWTSMFKALDASPASINFNEVYSALQTKVVDGQENPLAIISTAKLYEVQKYCSLTNHMWDGFWFLANRRAWEALPDDIRGIVAKHINAAGLKERDDVAKLNATLQQDLAAKGLVFNRPDPAPFRDKLRAAGFYTEWKGKYGDEAWSLLERSVGKLA